MNYDDVVHRSKDQSQMSVTSKATDNGDAPIKKEADEIKESKVSRKFSEQTTKRVVLLVLIVVMSEYIFQIDTYVDNQTSYQYSMELLYNFRNNSNLMSLMDFVSAYHSDETNYKIIDISYMLNGTSYVRTNDDISNYRDQDIDVVSYGDFS